MGDWRTVHLEGSIDETDVEKLRTRLIYDYHNTDLNQTFSCLGWSPQASLCGLNEWVKPGAFEAVGNLHERGYDVEDVATEVRILAALAPSLRLVIDVGGAYESEDVEATVLIGEDRTVAVLPPRIEKGNIPDSVLAANAVQAIQDATRR
jgi:hypothetical protein